MSIAFRIRMILCNNKGNCHNLYHRLPAEATSTCTELCKKYFVIIVTAKLRQITAHSGFFLKELTCKRNLKNK